MEFIVTIIETNTCDVTIEASTKEEAIEIVENDYFKHANDYVLEPENTIFK